MLPDDLDALLSDEEIIRTFTSVQHRIHAWDEGGGLKDHLKFTRKQLKSHIENSFPYEPNIHEEYSDYVRKWCGRRGRRFRNSYLAEEMCMDPSLTDQEIVRTFTPTQARIHDWDEQGGLERARYYDTEKYESYLKDAFPDVPDIVHEVAAYMQKWCGRFNRREQQVITEELLLQMISNTSCKDKDEVAKTLWTFCMTDAPSFSIGESDFGGTLTRYAADPGIPLLWPEITPSEADSPYLLERGVLAIDLDQTVSTRQLSIVDGKKRRHQNRSSEESASSVDSQASHRSASSDDFLEREPFCFLQIGEVYACKSEDWLSNEEQMSSGEPEIYEIPWESTGYVLVVGLDLSGRPKGPVYMVYNYYPAGDFPLLAGPRPEEMKWKDDTNTELPHVRAPYPSCDQKFFIAKVAERVGDLKENRKFDFEILREKRFELTQAKLAGIHQKIIPSSVSVGAYKHADKRPRGEAGLVMNWPTIDEI